MGDSASPSPLGGWWVLRPLLAARRARPPRARLRRTWGRAVRAGLGVQSAWPRTSRTRTAGAPLSSPSRIPSHELVLAADAAQGVGGVTSRVAVGDERVHGPP